MADGQRKALACGQKDTTDLDTQEGRSGTNETEGCTDVDFLDDVPCVVGRRVQHAVKCEAGIVDYMIKLSILSVIL